MKVAPLAITLPKIMEKPSAISYEQAKQRFRQVAVQKPKQKARLLPRLTTRQELFELEQQKFRQLELEVQKPKQKVAVMTKLMLKQKLMMAPPQMLKPRMKPPYRPPTTPPTFPTYREPRLVGFGLRRRREALFGRWYKREHPIASPRQVVSLVSGKRKKRAKKGSFGGRVRALVSG